MTLIVDLKQEILRLESQLESYNKLAAENAFKAKAAEAKLRKLQKQVEKINEILTQDEQLPPAV
jgi:hypothetical protein